MKKNDVNLKLSLDRTTLKTLSVKSRVRTGAYGGDDTSGRGQQSYAACNVHKVHV